MEGYIYVIKNNITSKIYIGKTVQDIQKRFKEHINEAYRDNSKKTHLNNAIRKYGAEQFYCELLYKCNYDDIDTLNNHLFIKEKEYIKQYNSFKNGYNSTIGGEGVAGLYGKLNSFYGKRHTKETKKRIGELSKQRNAIRATHTKEAIAKRAKIRSERMKKGDFTPKEIEQFKKLSKMKKGTKLPKEVAQKRLETIRKKRLDNPDFGKINMTDEMKTKIAKARNPNNIIQYDKNWNIIKIFNTLADVEKEYGYDRSHISKCCRGKEKSAYGCFWRYEKDKEIAI